MVKVHDVARMKKVVDIEGGLFGGNSFFIFIFLFHFQYSGADI